MITLGIAGTTIGCHRLHDPAMPPTVKFNGVIGARATGNHRARAASARPVDKYLPTCCPGWTVPGQQDFAAGGANTGAGVGAVSGCSADDGAQRLRSTSPCRKTMVRLRTDVEDKAHRLPLSYF